jgi:hypothetical protein
MFFIETAIPFLAALRRGFPAISVTHASGQEWSFHTD